MTHVTIHEPDPQVIAKLRSLAHVHGRSIEDEAREIVREAMAVTQIEPSQRPALGDWWVQHVRGLGEIELPSRVDPPRALPFGDPT